MPGRLIPEPCESYSNKTIPSIIPSHNHLNNNHFLCHILFIQEDTIDLKKQMHQTSPLIAIKSFLSAIKDKISRPFFPQPSVDTELDHVLSQGKVLSHDAEELYHLLNDEPEINLAAPSLRTKTGVILGGALLTSTLVGGALYYFQRPGREHHNATPENTIHNALLPLSPLPDSSRSAFNTYSPAAQGAGLDEKQDEIPVTKKSITEVIKKKSTHLNPLRIKSKNAAKSNKKNHHANNCPLIDKKHKTKLLSASYVYTTRQRAACLTESFNMRCKRAHRQAKAKKSCFHIFSSMVLKISGKYCLCPPPEWLEMNVIDPLTLTKKETLKPKRPLIVTQNSTSLTPSTPIITTKIIPSPVNHHPDNDEILKNRISDSYGYIVHQNKNLDRLLASTQPTPADQSKGLDVTQVNLIECVNQRENLTLSKTLRIISETLDNPVSTLLREGAIVIQYDYLMQGCVNNTRFYETSKKIETTVKDLASWMPGLDKLLFSVKFISSLLENYSDALDGNNINFNNFEDLNSRLIGLSKDIISSISTKDINQLTKKPDKKEIKKITKSLSYENNDLMLNIGYDGNKVKIQKKLNHFSDAENHGYIFYDKDNKWLIYDDVKLDNHIKSTMRKSAEIWKDTENTYLLKNSTPNIYGNGIIVRCSSGLHALINNEFHKIIEIQITDTVFRYLAEDDNKLRPIIFKGEKWCFEESSSPFASKVLYELLTDHYKINYKLVNKNINHQNVSPLTPGREIQFDKNYNEYIKINDRYFGIKKSPDASYYLDGEHYLLPLIIDNNKLHIRPSLFENTYCLHKEALNKILGMDPNENIFIDYSVIRHIDSVSKPQSEISIKNIIGNHMKLSTEIQGAITDEGENYLYYKDRLIQIHSNNDDTYILGDRKNSNENIVIYKNSESNTYFKISINRNKWQGLIKKSRRCIVKKQPMTACGIDYFETNRIRYLLDKNSNQGITIADHQDQLEPYHGFHAIYKKKDDGKILYYKGKGNLFFHARRNKLNLSSITPSAFILYGKNENEQIDLNYVISSISIIKDFDTKKIIFSTPVEAEENIFNINKKLSELFIKWQEEDKVYRKITTKDLKEIEEKIPLLNDMSELNALFDRSGKKAITTIEYSEKILKNEINKIPELSSVNELEIISLPHLKGTDTYPAIEDICSSAFKKSISHINDAITTIDHSIGKLNNYVVSVLGISDIRARDMFITSLKNKLERMKMIFDENHKENIMIIVKKKSTAENMIVLSSTGGTTLGFTILNDPLDRIFINTVMMHDFSEGLNAEGAQKVDNIKMEQPSSPRRNRVFFINLISDTMIHEAIHALGSPEDYLYLNINKEGYIDNISNSIQKIENSIAHDKMHKLKFEYLSKVYFMSNPLYKGFSIDSINQPEILKEVFREDSYFRSIVLLNNPDTISLLIRELASSSQQGESEIPAVKINEPAPLPTKK